MTRICAICLPLLPLIWVVTLVLVGTEPAAAQVPVPGLQGATAAAEGADPARGDLADVLQAAEAKGMRVIVIEPAAGGAAAPARAAAQGEVFSGGRFVELVGEVFDRFERMVAGMREPGWPQPSSNPMKPLTNATLTTLSMIALWFLMRSLGLGYSPRFAETPSTDRPRQVIASIAGILIAAALSFIPAFVIYGTGSKTVELVGWQLDLFVYAAILALASASLMDRVHDLAPDLRATVEPKAVAHNVDLLLVVLFFLVTAIQVLSFMYPEPEMELLSSMLAIVLVVGILIWLARRHRIALGVLAGTILPRAAPRTREAAWLVLVLYVVVSGVVALGRVLMKQPDPVALVLAPGISLLTGVFVYYLWMAAMNYVLGTQGPGLEDEEVNRIIVGPRRAFARAIGTSVGLLDFVGALGFGVFKEDGGLSFPALAAIVVITAYGAWAWVSTSIDRRLALETGGSEPHEQTGDGEGGVGLSRLATLLPLFRNVVFIGIFAIALLILLWNSGVNITPLFASAGIIGLAIGFGAQSLVRDIISGLFFLIDDAFRMGEYIETGGLKGTVERISIRSMQLRHHNGPLNTIPFGNIQDLTNYSRDWVIMKLPIKVTLDTDPERVRKLVKKLGVEMLDDPMVGAKFMEPLKSQGVLAIDNWGMTMRVKFKTRPGDQFVTRRVVYAKLHEMFEREGITFASRDVRIKVDGAEAPQGEAPAVPPSQTPTVAPGGASGSAAASPAAGASRATTSEGATASGTGAGTGAGTTSGVVAAGAGALGTAAVLKAAALAGDDEQLLEGGEGGSGGDDR